MKFLIIILSISVLLFKIADLGQLEESGFMNEKALVSTITLSFDTFVKDTTSIEINTYKGFEKLTTIENKELVQYEDKSFSELGATDRESYKGSINLITGTLYYMSLILVPAFLIYILFRALPFFISKFKERKATKKRTFSFVDKALLITTPLLFAEIALAAI